ncbi:MAG: hypothetical protein N3A61_07225, partial [Ignavibacteria bacterium]|nr:hypothetical protein [Ignavibacteria bacterium]
ISENATQKTDNALNYSDKNSAIPFFNEENKTIEKKYRPNIDLNQMIKCRSVVTGGLTYISPKTQLMVRWNDFGDIEYVPFSELITMNSSKRQFLFEPWLIVEDEDVVSHFSLNRIYEKMIDVENLNELFNQPMNEIKQKLQIIPSGIKELITSKASEMVQTGALVDIRIIKLLESELKTDLQVLIE